MFLSLHHTHLPTLLADKVTNNETTKTSSNQSNLFNILLAHNSPLMIHFVIFQRCSADNFSNLFKVLISTINLSASMSRRGKNLTGFCNISFSFQLTSLLHLFNSVETRIEEVVHDKKCFG